MLLLNQEVVHVSYPSPKFICRMRACLPARQVPASLLSIPLLLIILLFASSASAQETRPEGIYLTVAYLLGTLLAIGYKTVIACSKYLSRRVFRLSLLLYPMFLAFLISLPTVFYALPHFGPPRGEFGPDLIYAFLTVYTIFDITGDVFKLTGMMNDYFQQKAVEQEVGKD